MRFLLPSCFVLLLASCASSDRGRKAPEYDLDFPDKKVQGGMYYSGTEKIGRNLVGRTAASKTKEYTTPIFFIGDKGYVRDATWSKSMEGPHVGSRRKFNGTERRRSYGKIKAVLANSGTENVYEDALTVDPNAHLVMRDCQFKGRWKKGESADKPGADKLVQIDGGKVEALGCKFFKGARPLRVKTNSVAYIEACDFVGCDTPFLVDGAANPNSSNPFTNGKKGKGVVLVHSMNAFDCRSIGRVNSGGIVYIREGGVWSDNDKSVKKRGGSVKTVPHDEFEKLKKKYL